MSQAQPTAAALLETIKQPARALLWVNIGGRSDEKQIDELIDNAFSLIEHYIETEDFASAEQLPEAIGFTFNKVEAANQSHNANAHGKLAETTERNHLIFSAIAAALDENMQLTPASVQ